jgi:hypothetical protein
MASLSYSLLLFNGLKRPSRRLFRRLEPSPDVNGTPVAALDLHKHN